MPTVQIPQVQRMMGVLHQPGAIVGCGRWPYSSCHSDAWLAPWRGVVLSQYDPRAWQETTAFSSVPSQAKVVDHVNACHQQGLLAGEVPVLWDFENGMMVRWERVDRLMSADEDGRLWSEARHRASQAERRNVCEEETAATA